MSRHRASSMLNIYGLNYCADHTNGNIYEYSLDVYSDNGDPIIKQRDTAVIHGGLFGVPGKKLFFDEVEFIIIAGQTAVEGTGLGPQPEPPSDTPLTNCNEVWEIGTLTPDLHVAGVIAGTWDGTLITGTGVLQEANLDALALPNADGYYTGYSGGVPRNVFVPDCQWYIYSGPEQNGSMTYPTMPTTAAWNTTGTGTATITGVGGTGLANNASIVTGTSISDRYSIYRTGTITGVTQDGNPVTGRIVFAKESGQPPARLGLANSGTGNPSVGVTIDLETGDYVINSFRLGANPSVELKDIGDWWELLVQCDTAADGLPGNAAWYITPATNDIVEDDTDVTLTGHVTVWDTQIFYPLTIGLKRGTGVNPSPFGAWYVYPSDTYIDLANHSDTEGGYYIEWRPQFSDSEISRDVEILSLDDTTGLLYYDYSTKLLTSTDGTNTATVPITVVADTKYRLGVAFGSSALRVGVDGVWGTPASYDGVFPKSTIFQICPQPEGANYWREFRGFQISYLDALNEITLLMDGGRYVNPGLPPPPDADGQIEIVAPFWTGTGNWIDISALTTTTFATMFGEVIEGADFNAVYAVNKAALVNTSDSGNRLQVQDTIDCTNAYLAVTDASGNVVDSMIYSGVATGDSVLVPTGANYYVVCTSDTGNAKIKKWDSELPFISGSVTWESFFGSVFSLPGWWDSTNIIPADGVSISFTVPLTAFDYRLSFTTYAVPSVTSTRTGSVGQVVGDYTSAPTLTWGASDEIDCGINTGGTFDIELIPGETYFFCVRNNDPSASTNYVRIQASVRPIL